MIIDTHTHFYDPSRPEGVPWPRSDNDLLYRRVMPADFRRVAGPCGVEGTVVVEASPWVEDNQWLLDLAATEPTILGVIGRLDPFAGEFSAQLERFAADALYRGVRLNSNELMPHLDKAPLRAALVELTRRGLTLDVGAGLDAVAELHKLKRLAPDLRVVLNHTAKAPDATGRVDANWQAVLRAAADLPRVYWKLSGIVENALKHHDPIPLEPAFYRPVFETMLDILGPEQLLYASNWPVCERAASYEAQFGILHDWLGRLDPDARRRIESTNAHTAYGPLRVETRPVSISKEPEP